jgi:hypothetical protein
MDKWTALAVMCGFVCLCVVLCVAGFTGSKSERQNKTQVEAVSRGFATFGSDGTNVVFKWKETK